MAAHLLAEIDVIDPEGVEAYRRDVPALLTRYGGRYLARGGEAEILEAIGRCGAPCCSIFPT